MAREVAVVDGETVDTSTGEVLEAGTAVVPAAERHALAQRRELVGGLIRPVASIDEIVQAQESVREIIQKALKPGRDYGTIPGTNKPTMYKAGAERTCAAFAVYPDYEILEKEIDHNHENVYMGWEWHPTIRGKKVDVEKKSYGLYRYVIKCKIIHRESGLVIGSGVGSCSSLESKYISRPRDLENTILKMAKKRAYVDATLSTFGLSDQFTQDVEDMAEGAFQNDGGPVHNDNPGKFGEHLADREAFLDHRLEGGKHQGKTWRELCWGDPSEERGYVRWACGDAGGVGMKDLSDEQKEWLREEANKAKAQQDQAEDAARGQERLPLGEQGSEEAAEKAGLVRQCINLARNPALTQEQQAYLLQMAANPAQFPLEHMRETVEKARKKAGLPEPKPALSPFELEVQEQEDDLPFD